MDESIIEEYIKKNLKIKVEMRQENFRSNAYGTIKLILKEEVISEDDFEVFI